MEIYVAPDHVGIETDGGIFDPSVFQGNENTCAIHSQYHVLKDYGYTGTVEDLIREAEAKGWYDPATGTSLENVGKLLEEHGVPCNVYVNANEYNLISELAQGKRVIVGLDSGEIWNDEGALQDFWEKITGGGADHAVVVSGINTTDPDNIKVVLTDSGAGHAAIEYPLDQFMDAWQDGECIMWVPQEPPKPEFNLERLVNFDWGLGHIASAGNMSFEEIISQQSTFELIDITKEETWWESVIEYYEDVTSYEPLYVSDVSNSFDTLTQGSIYATSDSSFDNDFNSDENITDVSDASSADAMDNLEHDLNSNVTENIECGD